jgi:hypothetical protein
MNNLQLEKFIEESQDARYKLRNERAKSYSRNSDRLHNFRRQAALKGTTPERALEGNLSKHVISIYDMLDDLDNGGHHSMKTWREKLHDAQNYLDLLHAMLAERYGELE